MPYADLPPELLEFEDSKVSIQQQFQLIGQMSKKVNLTNSSLQNLIATLQSKSSLTLGEEDDKHQTEGVDPQALLKQTNANIKNLNYLLMKLVEVQQKSILIQKNLPQHFVVMDRIPIYLEIDAALMPFPCKVLIRPNYRKFGYSEKMVELVMQHLVVYASTTTKNPSARKNQMTVEGLGCKSFYFAPYQDAAPIGFKDKFQDKVYLCVSYDLSHRAAGAGEDKS